MGIIQPSDCWMQFPFPQIKTDLPSMRNDENINWWSQRWWYHGTRWIETGHEHTVYSSSHTDPSPAMRINEDGLHYLPIHLFLMDDERIPSTHWFNVPLLSLSLSRTLALFAPCFDHVRECVLLNECVSLSVYVNICFTFYYTHILTAIKYWIPRVSWASMIPKSVRKYLSNQPNWTLTSIGLVIQRHVSQNSKQIYYNYIERYIALSLSMT